jgi:hypothetical protein
LAMFLLDAKLAMADHAAFGEPRHLLSGRRRHAGEALGAHKARDP